MYGVSACTLRREIGAKYSAIRTIMWKYRHAFEKHLKELYPDKKIHDKFYPLKKGKYGKYSK